MRKSISIHALCEEGDDRPGTLIPIVEVFLSTPSARRATAMTEAPNYIKQAISIHALCEEGDTFWRN